MGRRKAPPWTSEEVAILQEFYPDGGIDGVTDMLPDRSWQAIHVMAWKLGIRCKLVTDAPAPVLAGSNLERAIILREEQNWSFARIGAEFGVSEAGACNAVLIALCPRKGFTPAERDDKGRLLPAGLERLRLALRKGMKGADIQLQLGLSAGRIAEERRRYSRELKERGKAQLPPPGNGMAYSGAAVRKEKKADVEHLLLEGFGALKITERTGVSKTSIQRIRRRLIRRLARRGETLPGCDRDGNRVTKAKESRRYIPAEAEAELRRLLMAREPVARAAAKVGIGGKSAYRIRDESAAELAAQGKDLPRPIFHGSTPMARSLKREANWLPPDKLQHYRDLCHLHGIMEAKRLILQEMAEEKVLQATARRRPKTFEEQLAAVRAGAGLVATFKPFRVMPDATLGGVSAGML